MADELFLIDGNSLAYRAFFALPESIATSTGVPTNAIFGFASMLVKILTDYGPKATVVVWDAGYTGRKELYADYKAQRSTRPDLLKEQWPHLEPLVDAFGYRNLRVEGYEADDVIASIVEKARHEDPAVPVMVVTGDRDAYQLVTDGVRIMTTSRGITDTKVYDSEGVEDRYGIPPALVPDFIGLKGDTSDNIPGVPGIGDKTAAELLQRFGSLEGVLENIDQISGAKRKQNLIDHAEDARVSKQLATAKRDIPIELEIGEFVAAPADRSKLREVFREFELREPLRRLEEALGSADAAAPAPVGETQVAAKVRQGSLNDIRQLPHTEVAVAVRAAEVPEDALFAPEPGFTFAVHPDGADTVLVGRADRAEDVVEAVGTRPVIAHDAKSLGLVPQNLAHDTEVAAYLLEPARRAYPFRELWEERGFTTDVEDPAAA
ncbi:MAG TPA: 5'-3' exonuclease H3TH domain-containing protein, partial [Solirubrobacteraceae bacterium]